MDTRRVLAGSLMALVALAGCMSEVDGDLQREADLAAAAAGNGNGAPAGSHFTLNLIGRDNPMTTSSSGGSVIHVPLSGSTQIQLSEGAFKVLDNNCTDSTCGFQLPNPDPENDGVTTYSVFVRALGKPGGSSSMTTCATDAGTGELYCSVYSSVQTRTKGRQTFSNVSKQLLYVYYYDDEGRLVRAPLFDDSLEGYYWQYDNNGLKTLQLRFYEVPTDVN
jgi:hypothetical protein